jgi:hypothetical protein
MLGGLAFLLVGAGVACGPEGPDPDVSAVKKRASFETSCPASKLKTKWLDDDGNTIGVSGCGEKLVYVRSCHGQGLAEECQWVLNSDARSKHREEE